MQSVMVMTAFIPEDIETRSFRYSQRDSSNLQKWDHPSDIDTSIRADLGRFKLILLNIP
jgi:hypothetical protein